MLGFFHIWQVSGIRDDDFLGPANVVRQQVGNCPDIRLVPVPDEDKGGNLDFVLSSQRGGFQR